MMCIKCKIRLVTEPFNGYNKPVCWICNLKQKKMYNSAKECIGGFFDWRTGFLKGGHHLWHKEHKLGWSFYQRILWTGLFLAVLKCTSLNKTPKTTATLKDYFTDWQLKIAKEYNKKDLL